MKKLEELQEKLRLFSLKNEMPLTQVAELTDTHPNSLYWFANGQRSINLKTWIKLENFMNEYEKKNK